MVFIERWYKAFNYEVAGVAAVIRFDARFECGSHERRRRELVEIGQDIRQVGTILNFVASCIPMWMKFIRGSRSTKTSISVSTFSTSYRGAIKPATRKS